jgi:hypothetical protein
MTGSAGALPVAEVRSGWIQVDGKEISNRRLDRTVITALTAPLGVTASA